MEAPSSGRGRSGGRGRWEILTGGNQLVLEAAILSTAPWRRRSPSAVIRVAEVRVGREGVLLIGLVSVQALVVEVGLVMGRRCWRGVPLVQVRNRLVVVVGPAGGCGRTERAGMEAVPSLELPRGCRTGTGEGSVPLLLSLLLLGVASTCEADTLLASEAWLLKDAVPPVEVRTCYGQAVLPELLLPAVVGGRDDLLLLDRAGVVAVGDQDAGTPSTVRGAEDALLLLLLLSQLLLLLLLLRGAAVHYCCCCRGQSWVRYC